MDAFQPTDEYLGLPTGFLLAGAKAVVSSLWKVNSIATAFLLDEFYRPTKQKVTLYLSSELHRKLKTRSAIDTEPMSELAERALDFYLANSELVEEAEYPYGQTHRVDSCPTCDSSLVLRDEELVPLGEQPAVIGEDEERLPLGEQPAVIGEQHCLIEDHLQLFTKVARQKTTADTYLYKKNPEKAKFYYHQIIDCLEKIQEDQDINTRRHIMNSYLEIYKRIVAVCIYTKDETNAFLYADISRNKYLVERLAQQDAPLPQTVPVELSKQIYEAKYDEKKNCISIFITLLINIEKI